MVLIWNDPARGDREAVADAVFTLGCGDGRPVYPGKRHLDWNEPDPDGLPVEQERLILHELDSRVQALLGQLARR